MNKFVIIGVYFGTFPQWFDLWEMSALHNRDIDYLIFTDINRKSTKNIKYVNLSMKDFNELASDKLGFKINVKRAHKLCDFKIAYGRIFHDYIKEYLYWAHTDFDLVYGRISYFLTKYHCEHYDRFLPLGHLAFYKNTKEVNSYYEQYIDKNGLDYKLILQDEKNHGFDEVGMVELYHDKGYTFFENRVFAEINQRYKRFKLNRDDPNYEHQIFFYENGKIYRAYFENNILKTDEFMYLHFQSRNLPNHGCDGKSFYITSTGMYPKNFEKVTMDIIRKYNPYPGKLYEFVEISTFHRRLSIRCRINHMLNQK